MPLYGSYDTFLDHSRQTFNGRPDSSEPSVQAASFTTTCVASGCVAHWLRLTELTENPNAPALFDYQWVNDRWESVGEYPFHCDDGSPVTTHQGLTFSRPTPTEVSPVNALGSARRPGVRIPVVEKQRSPGRCRSTSRDCHVDAASVGTRMDYFPYVNSDPDDSPSLQKALTGGALQRIGWYRFYFADERWEWSAEAQQIHGYDPEPSPRPPSWCSLTSTLTTTNRSRRRRRHSSNSQAIQHPSPHHHHPRRPSAT